MLGITGFCREEVKLFGPLQLYVAPVIVDACRFSELPAHNGSLLLTEGAEGPGL